MKTNFIIPISIALIIVGAVILSSLVRPDESSFEENREELLSQLHSAIKDAEKMGKYRCCIEPLCTMCYLGEWIWEDGTCDCDGMIAKGEWDKVCPQCIKGIKEGKCKSEIGACPVL